MFITDDVIVEETETLSFHIASLNTSFVRVREDRAWKEVHILDNNVLLVRAICIFIHLFCIITYNYKNIYFYLLFNQKLVVIKFQLSYELESY